jgi:pullulanase/glycogen debranching enzyme
MAAKNLIKTCQACQYGERRTKEGQKTFYGKFSMARKPISTRRDLGWKGVNFALFADNATGVDLCVFDSAAGEKEVRRYNPNKLLIDPYAKAIASAVGWHEIGKTQQGNNNAYCQDNELSWIDRQRAAWGSEVERIIFIQKKMQNRTPALLSTCGQGQGIL